jgi:hypothetical protein
MGKIPMSVSLGRDVPGAPFDIIRREENTPHGVPSPSNDTLFLWDVTKCGRLFMVTPSFPVKKPKKRY